MVYPIFYIYGGTGWSDKLTYYLPDNDYGEGELDQAQREEDERMELQ